MPNILNAPLSTMNKFIRTNSYSSTTLTAVSIFPTVEVAHLIQFLLYLFSNIPLFTQFPIPDNLLILSRLLNQRSTLLYLTHRYSML